MALKVGSSLWRSLMDGRRAFRGPRTCCHYTTVRSPLMGFGGDNAQGAVRGPGSTTDHTMRL